MKKTKILQKNAPVLREVANPVPLKSITSKEIGKALRRMKDALHGEDDGVAIAAPQIGESLRMFVVSGRAVAWSSRAKKTDEHKELNDLVFINPEIIKASKKKRRVEEGCLSVRWLYGKVNRSEKVTLRAYNETGQRFERGASGLLAQIFQHETDHLNGVLFIDKAKHIQNIPPAEHPKFVFFGSSRFSGYVLEELKAAGYSPLLNITSAKEPLPVEKLKKANAALFVVASFGKILPKEIIELPKHHTLNVHPSLLPQLRGPAPIQNTILDKDTVPGITIIRMDEEMDHGPILAQARMRITPWPDYYEAVEEKLGRAGGKVLGVLLAKWVGGKITERPQDHSQSSYTKLISKEDGLLDLDHPAEENLRKVLAYSAWPGAYFFFKNKRGKEIRVIVKDAVVRDGQFHPTRVIPAGKKEMDWQDFLRGN